MKVYSTITIPKGQPVALMALFYYITLQINTRITLKKTFMKKILIILFVFTTISKLSFGQLFFGLQGGVNLSSLSSASVNELKTKPGFHAGFILNTGRFGNYFSIMPSVLYSTRGFKYNYTTTTTNTVPDTSGNNVTSTVTETALVNATLGYIDIPVMLTFFFSANAGVFIQAGPQFSFLINDNSDVNTSAEVSTNGGKPQPTDPTINNSISFNKSDMSVIGGVGYKFQRLLLVYLRASTGFLNVQKEGFITDAIAGHNLSYQAGIALTFP
jgi:hypothetical protein